jgi:hypothetical protein
MGGQYSGQIARVNTPNYDAAVSTLVLNAVQLADKA